MFLKIENGRVVPMLCTKCGAPVSWTVRVFEFVGNWVMLYYYASMLREDRISTTEHNVWGCDRCKVAGALPERSARSAQSEG